MTKPIVKICYKLLYRTWEKFGGGKFWRIWQMVYNSPKFSTANSYKYSEITEDLPADSPKISSPFASSVMIRQNFLPPKFSHVRYVVISWPQLISKLLVTSAYLHAASD